MNTYPTYLSKLNTGTLQNKALRIVTKSGWYQNVLPLYQKFNLLNLQNLHKFEIAKFIHNQINQHLSPNFNDYFTLAKFSHNRQTRTTASLNLILPLYKTKRTQQSIKYYGNFGQNSRLERGCRLDNVANVTRTGLRSFRSLSLERHQYYNNCHLSTVP